MAPLQVESVQLKANRIVAEKEEKSAGGILDVLALPDLNQRLHPQRLHLNLQPVALLRELLVARAVSAAVVTAQQEERILTSASRRDDY